jgi:hypothetical protein
VSTNVADAGKCVAEAAEAMWHHHDRSISMLSEPVAVQAIGGD